MTRLGLLFECLREKERSTLLQILVKRFIVDLQGKIIDCELNLPFAFLSDLTHELFTQYSDPRSSTQIFVGALTKTHLELREIAVEEFLEMLRFDQRDKLAELPTELLRESSR
jgi:hypothetical protein